MATQFGMLENIVPLLAPVDLTSTNPVQSGYIDLANANRASFLVYFGVVTSATAADTMLLQVQCSTGTTSNATEEFIAFKYRLGATVSVGNDWGAVTDGTTAGVSLGASTVFDGYPLLIDVDPSVVAAKMADARYVRVVATPQGDGAYSAVLACIVGFVDPKYRQTTMQKLTVT
jgi:hypothetical protein